MFPPAPGTMLDSTRCATLKLPVTPDVLLLPSDLNGFAKLVPACSAGGGPTVCINPGRVSKGNSGGTFALFHMGSLQPGIQSFDQSCKVDVVRV
jgi:DNA polymerase alpha subunit B